MWVLAGILIYACIVIYILSTVAALMWALLINLLVLVVLLLVGLAGYAFITDAGKSEDDDKPP